MKHNKKHNLLGWLSGLTLILATACTSIDDLDLAKVEEKGETVVTFTVQPELQSGGMRATTVSTPTIGKGDSIDALIYAVYKETTEDGTTGYVLQKAEKIAKGGKVGNINIAAGTGQTVVACKTSEPTKVILVLEKESKYKIAFWAQNSKTDAYVTNDLKAVQVKYNGAKNNDESRDAFCASIMFTANGGGHDVTLRRPLAQINVGTTGWDYEGAAVLRPSAVGYTKSKITLKGVAQYYNVLAGLDESTSSEENDVVSLGKTLNDDEHPLVEAVTFEYETIPAFMNITEEDWQNKTGKKYEPFDENEEFLMVDLDGKDGIKGYKGWEDYENARKDKGSNFSQDDFPDTETFKYLSMCYVLVPETLGTGQSLPENVSSGSVLSSVEFTTYGEIINVDDTNTDVTEDDDDDDDEPAKTDEGGENDDDDEDEGEGNEDASDTTPQYVEKTFKIDQVPVQKNWRTNILGNGFFVGNIKCTIDVVPDYCGDYNNIDDVWQNGGFNEGENDGDDWTWEGEGDPNGDANFPPDDDYYPKNNDNGDNSADNAEGEETVKD